MARREDKVRAEARAKLAFELFVQGQTYEKIAKACGFKQTGHLAKVLEKLINAQPEPDVRDWRDKQTARYFHMLQQLMGTDGYKNKKLDTMGEVRQVLMRLDKIHGLEGQVSLMGPGSKIEVEIVRDRKDGKPE